VQERSGNGNWRRAEGWSRFDLVHSFRALSRAPNRCDVAILAMLA
jgi:hypothetical protein